MQSHRICGAGAPGCSRAGDALPASCLYGTLVLGAQAHQPDWCTGVTAPSQVHPGRWCVAPQRGLSSGGPPTGALRGGRGPPSRARPLAQPVPPRCSPACALRVRARSRLKLGVGDFFPCTIDLYVEWRDHSGQWLSGEEGVGKNWINTTLGFGPGCERAECFGTPPPPPGVLAVAPGASYVQRWHPSVYVPNQPGTYRIMLRYNTDPAAVQVARVGYPDLRRVAAVPASVAALRKELRAAASAPLRVADDGLPPDNPGCHAV
jgi:hypothetical protein